MSPRAIVLASVAGVVLGQQDLVVTLTNNTTVQIWSLQGLLHELAHDSQVEAAHIDEDTGHVVTVRPADGHYTSITHKTSLAVWTPEGSQLHDLPNHNLIATGKRRLLTHLNFETATIWDPSSTESLCEFSLPGKDVFSSNFDPTGAFVAVMFGRNPTKLQLWDVASCSMKSERPIHSFEDSAGFDATGTRLWHVSNVLLGDEDVFQGNLTFYGTESGDMLETMGLGISAEFGFKGLMPSQGNTMGIYVPYTCTGCLADQGLTFFDPTSGALISNFSHHEMLAFSSDGYQVLSRKFRGYDQTPQWEAAVWDVAAGKLIGSGFEAYGVADSNVINRIFGHGDQFLASGCVLIPEDLIPTTCDSQIRVLDVGTKKSYAYIDAEFLLDVGTVQGSRSMMV